MSDPFLKVHSLTKNYGNLKVLNDVTFEMKPGEILGLVGRRGSGKSTLLRLIGGGIQPSHGKITFQGEKVQFTSSYQARREGIESVHQLAQLVDQLDVIKNVFLGHEITGPRILGMPQIESMFKIAKNLIAEFDLSPDLINEHVADLTNEQRHLIALMRAFSHPFKLLLLDDVLPNLSYQRQVILLDLIQEHAKQDSGVIICSENLKHLFRITNRILVLYEGRLVADFTTSECTPRDVVEYTIGASSPEQVTPVIWALENYQKAQQQTEELFQKQVEMHETLEASDQLNRQLVDRLQRQVTAVNRLNAALQDAQRRLMTESEEERKALARDLHDSVIQDLLGLIYRLETLEAAGQNALESEFNEIRTEIRQVITDLRQVCRDLRPPTIDNHGLSSAIPSLIQEWEERTGIQVSVEIDSQLGRLPEWIELSIFRIIQEALSNVAKHAEAGSVQLVVKEALGGNLEIRIADDGKGIEAIPNLASLPERKNFGLVGISERAALLDGKLKIQTSLGGGFSLEIEIPNPDPFSRREN